MSVLAPVSVLALVSVLDQVTCDVVLDPNEGCCCEVVAVVDHDGFAVVVVVASLAMVGVALGKVVGVDPNYDRWGEVGLDKARCGYDHDCC